MSPDFKAAIIRLLGLNPTIASAQLVAAVEDECLKSAGDDLETNAANPLGAPELNSAEDLIRRQLGFTRRQWARF